MEFISYEAKTAKTVYHCDDENLELNEAVAMDTVSVYFISHCTKVSLKT